MVAGILGQADERELRSALNGVTRGRSPKLISGRADRRAGTRIASIGQDMIKGRRTTDAVTQDMVDQLKSLPTA